MLIKEEIKDLRKKKKFPAIHKWGKSVSQARTDSLDSDLVALKSLPPGGVLMSSFYGYLYSRYASDIEYQIEGIINMADSCRNIARYSKEEISLDKRLSIIADLQKLSANCPVKEKDICRRLRVLEIFYESAELSEQNGKLDWVDIVMPHAILRTLPSEKEEKEYKENQKILQNNSNYLRAEIMDTRNIYLGLLEKKIELIKTSKTKFKRNKLERTFYFIEEMIKRNYNDLNKVTELVFHFRRINSYEAEKQCVSETSRMIDIRNFLASFLHIS